MARPLTCAISISLLALATGCAQLRFHRDRNAPGISDVENPPPPGQIEHQRPLPPQDPGENMLTFNPGVYGGAGARLGQPEGQRAVGVGGIELTLNRGFNKRSHYKDGLLVYPIEGKGVSLGWTFLQGRSGDVGVGPVYVEASLFRILLGTAVGYAFDPSEIDHGPQVTAWLGPSYARARYMFDGGFEIYIGCQIKVPLIWVWSR